nr:DUF4332 domain-containing protein [candidate division Zixibacteria bacterium]
MDEKGFLQYLKRRGKKEKVAGGLAGQVQAFEAYLSGRRKGGADKATKQDILAYAESLDKAEAKKRMRGLALYYRFIDNTPLANLASQMREKEIAGTRKAFKIGDFRDVDEENIAKLEAIGIVTVDHMLAAGKTPEDRRRLAERTGIPSKAILELVKLSDLSRLGAIKSVRARLYYEAGLDTPHKFAKWEPDALRQMLIDFVKKTGFNGIAPLPKELKNAIEKARQLPKVVQY